MVCSNWRGRKKDKNIEDTVRREVKEETNLDIDNIQYLNWIFKYQSLGQEYTEKVFVTHAFDKSVTLNEESIDYKWCNIDEFVEDIKWYTSKDELKKILEQIMNNKIPFKEEKIEIT